MEELDNTQKTIFNSELKDNKLTNEFLEEIYSFSENYLTLRELSMGEKKLENLFEQRTIDNINKKRQILINLKKLRNTIEFYNTINERANKNILKLIVDELVELQQIIKCFNTIPFNQFLEKSNLLIQTISKKLEKLQNQEKQFYEILNEIIDKKSTNFDYIKKIQQFFENLSNEKDEEKSYKIFLKHQWLKVLFFQIKIILHDKKKFFQEKKNNQIQLIFDQNTKQQNIHPSICRIKKLFYQQLNKLLDIVYQNCPELNKKYTQKLIIQNLQEEIKETYFWIENFFQKLKLRLNKTFIIEVQELEQNLEDLESKKYYMNKIININDNIYNIEEMDDEIVYEDIFIIYIYNMKISMINLYQNQRNLILEKLVNYSQDSLYNIQQKLNEIQNQYSQNQQNQVFKKVFKIYKDMNKFKRESQDDFELLEMVQMLLDCQEKKNQIYYQVQNTLEQWNYFEKTLTEQQLNFEQKEGEYKKDLKKQKDNLIKDMEQFFEKQSLLQTEKQNFSSLLNIKDQWTSIQTIKKLINEWKELQNNIYELKQNVEFFKEEMIIEEEFKNYNEIKKIFDSKDNQMFLELFEIFKIVFNKTDIQWLDFLYNQIGKNLMSQFNIFQKKFEHDYFQSSEETSDKYLNLLGQFIFNINLISKEKFEDNDLHQLQLSMQIQGKFQDWKFNDIINNENLIQMNINQIKQTIREISENITIKESIQKLNSWKENREFSLAYVKTEKQYDFQIITDYEELVQELEDNYIELKVIKESKHNFNYLSEINIQEKNFNFIRQILPQIMYIQRKFIYLEPIINKNQFKEFKENFKELEIVFGEIMKYIQNKKIVCKLKEFPQLEIKLNKINKDIEIIQYKLMDYLEQKRQEFPRLYFLGDDYLIELLGHSEEQIILESHLRKIFEGVHKLKINNNLIEGIESHDIYQFPEILNFKKPIQIGNQSIEIWLNLLQNQITNNLQSRFNEIQFDKINSRHLIDVFTMYLNFPGQIMLILLEIIFTNFLKDNFRSLSFSSLKDNYNTFLKNLTSLKKNPSKLVQEKIKKILIVVVRQIRILENIEANPDWQWFKLLKYEVNNSKVTIQCCEVNQNYLWEYYGNKSMLVFTPLTEKCFITFYQSLRMNQGCNLTGPAGTGKTETVKALGMVLGRQVLVFNCDENLDFKSLFKIFKGLLMAGSWGCFDEFNRLQIEKLSTISQTIQDIQTAKNLNKKEIFLNDKYPVTIKQQAGIYITMNPSGKDYGGRCKLPENLKQLFRVVNVSKPDNLIIIQVTLFSEGFMDYKSLKILKKRLSKQRYYDWSLRKIKSILHTAGDIYHEEQEQITELKSLIKAININIQSNLDNNDQKPYNQTLKEIFEFEQQNEDIKIDSESQFNEKFHQFSEIIKRRTGVIIFGESGKMKTRLWKDFIQKNNSSHYIINAKSFERQNLIGQLDINTNYFVDGILTLITRKVLQKKNKDQYILIIIDSEIDPEWIEALNSVLDDNKLLTLPSGERLQYDHRVKFIFECRKLNYASPATISRMGLLNMESINLNLQKNLNDQNYSQKLMEILIEKNKLNFDEKDLILQLKNLQKLTQEDSLDELISSYFPLIFNSDEFEQFKDLNELLMTSNIQACIEYGRYNFLKDFVQKLIVENYSLKIIHNNIENTREYLQSILKEKQSTETFNCNEISCTYNMKSSYLIDLLKKYCLIIERKSFKEILPLNCHKQIFILSHFESISQDKYQDVQIYEFVHQLIYYKQFHDSKGVFYRLDDNIQFILVCKQKLENQHYKKINNGIIVINFQNEQIFEQNSNFELGKNSGINMEYLGQLQMNCMQITDFPITILNSLNHKQIKKYYKAQQKLENKSDQNQKLFLRFQFFSQILLQFMNKSLYNNVLQQIPEFQTIFDQYFNMNEIIKINDQQKYKNIIEKFQQQYHKIHHELQIYLDDFHLQIVQILEYLLKFGKNQNLYIIGKTSQGKKSLIKILSQKLNFEINIFPNLQKCEEKQFQKFYLDAIKHVLIEDKNLILIFQSHQFKNQESFDFFMRFVEKREIESLNQEEIEFLVKNDKTYDNKTNILKHYYQKLNQNLFIIYLDNNLENSAEIQLQKFPIIYSSMNIINLNLLQCKEFYPKKYLNFIFNKKELSQNIITNMITIFEQIFNNNWNDMYSFIQGSQKIEEQQKIILLKEKERLESGIQKIENAENFIKNLNNEAIQKGQKIEENQIESEKFLKEIKQIYEKTEHNRIKIKEMKEKLQQEEVDILNKKNEVEIELSEITPLIEEVKKEIKSIKKEYITELKSLSTPPTKIVIVLKALMKIMDQKQNEWSDIKSFISQKNIIDLLLNYDARNMKEKTYNELKNYIQKQSEYFEKNSIYRASKAAGPICEFIKAQLQLKETLINIQPLENQLKFLELQLNQSKVQLQQYQNQILQIDDKIITIKKDYVEKTGEAENLKVQLKEINLKIEQAKILLDSLIIEKNRWKEKIEQTDQTLKNVTIQSILSSFCINVNCTNKTKTLLELLKVFQMNNFNLERFILDPKTLFQMIKNGIENDKQQLLKGVQLIHSNKIPFVLDPNQNLLKFFENFYSDQNLTVQFQEKNLLSQLELAIKFGKKLIVSQINDRLPLYFKNIVKKQIIKRFDGKLEIELSGKIINYHQNFQLILFTKESYQILDSIKEDLPYLNIINNGWSKMSLKKSFINKIINFFDPEMLKEQNLLIQSENQCKQQLFEIEDQILIALNNCQANILEDKILGESLAQAKIQSQEINNKIKSQEDKKLKIKKYQEKYEDVSQYLTNVYQELNKFDKLNNFYCFSMDKFLEILYESLQETKELENFSLMDTFPRILIKNLVKKLGISFQKDDLVLIVLLLINVKEKIFQESLNTFLIMNNNEEQQNQSNKEIIENLKHSQIELYQKITNNKQTWQKWSQVDQCEKQWPQLSDLKLSFGQQLLILMIYRKDRFIIYCQEYIQKYLGLNTQNLTFNANKISNQIQQIKQPIIFITQQENDPSLEIKQIFINNSQEQLLIEMACGQITVEKIIEEIQEKKSNHFYIKNLHLSPLISSQLGYIQSFVSENQILILSTENNNFIKKSFIQNSFIISFEKISGINYIIQSLYNFIIESDLHIFGPNQYHLIFELALVHAIVTEREKYVPLTWTKKYEFSQSDFLAALDCLKFLKKMKILNFVNIFKFLLVECFYGSKVDIEEDYQTLNEIVEIVFNDINKQLPQELDDKINNHLKASKQLNLQETNLVEYIGSLNNNGSVQIDEILKKLKIMFK